MAENNSRMFRGPKNNTINKAYIESCYKGSTDCMFLSSDGACAAESCIFDELPLMTIGSKEVTCSICGEETTNVSTYNGSSIYICPKCQEDIKKVIDDHKLCSVCNTNEVSSVDQCICTDCQTKLVKTMKDSICPICGTNTGINGSICSTCADKIRGKINE